MKVLSNKSLPKLVVDLNAIKHNYDVCKETIDGKEVAAVIKANAYGLGQARISKMLEEEAGCSNFFVAFIIEGMEARQTLSDSSNIFVFHGIMEGEEEIAYQNNLIPVLNDFYQLDIWQNYAKKIGQKLRCAIHFDSGMNRLGFDINSAKKLRDNIDSHLLDVTLVLSHLSYAENKNSELNLQQIEKFKQAAKYFKGAKLSLANSPSMSLGNEYYFDMIRVGRALYGPNKYAALPESLKPAVSIYAPIIQIRKIEEDSPVGYAASHIAKKGSKIATLAIGYADGYMRLFGNISKVYYEGYHLPVIGKISMDLVTIDVTNVPDEFLALGNFVELIGKNIDFHDILVQSGTSSSELFARLGGRMIREYVRK
ncbi:MAG: alanine racemase [Alphaproteobacteria bacterium]|nr:alanine racemase [Alphaproteobacteria bacterium]